MIVYRAIRKNEINSENKLLEQNSSSAHFFLHYNGALMMIKNDKDAIKSNKYYAIAFYDIPDDVLKDNLEYGVYYISKFPSNDGLYTSDKIDDSFVSILLPEFIIPTIEVPEDSYVGIEKDDKIEMFDRDHNLGYELRSNQVSFVNYLEQVYRYIQDLRDIAPHKSVDLDDILPILTSDSQKYFREKAKN